MVTALKMLGFKKVFDVNMGADFTVKEEAEELVERIKQNKNLPQFSSCCPAWFKFVQNHFKAYEGSLSTCKSPTEMLGAIIKIITLKNTTFQKIKSELSELCPARQKRRKRTSTRRRPCHHDKRTCATVETKGYKSLEVITNIF